jgi:hypothetical protein
VNRPNVRGCPSCGQPSLSGCSSCLSFASSFHIVLLPGRLFYRPDLLKIEPIDWVVWTSGLVAWLIYLIVQAAWMTVLVVLAVWTIDLVVLAAWTTKWF